MKANVFLTILSIVLACLIGYFAYILSAGDENSLICGICSTICFASTLIPIMGLKYESSKVGTNVRVFSIVSFTVFLISNFCFAGLGVRMPLYLLVNGILLVIYLAIFYKLQGIKNL